MPAGPVCGEAATMPGSKRDAEDSLIGQQQCQAIHERHAARTDLLLTPSAKRNPSQRFHRLTLPPRLSLAVNRGNWVRTVGIERLVFCAYSSGVSPSINAIATALSDLVSPNNWCRTSAGTRRFSSLILPVTTTVASPPSMPPTFARYRRAIRKKQACGPVRNPEMLNVEATPACIARWMVDRSRKASSG